MTQLPITTATSEAFITLMTTIWEGTCEPAEDGGTTILMHPLYHEWYDAVRVARTLGATRLWPMRHAGAGGGAYAWPDGTRTWIAWGGCAVAPIRRRAPKGPITKS